MVLSRLKLFIFFFCYSLIVAIIFQNFLVPKLNPLSTLGLFGDDALHFHAEAIKLSVQIHQHGWTSWKLFPGPSSSINVSVLAALYFLFGQNPALMLPINATIHAASGVIVFQIAYELSRSRKSGFYAGLLCALLFVLSPSALNWYGQIHKDGWLIIGVLLMTLSFIRMLTQETEGLNFKNYYKNLLIYASGLIFASISRPYIVKLLVVVLTLCFLLFVIFSFKKKQTVTWVSLFFLSVITVSVVTITVVKSLSQESNLGDTYSTYSLASWEWKKSTWLHHEVDKQIETLARTRLGFINYANAINGKSNIDLEIKPDNALDIILYAPRATEIAVLSPFPTTWLNEVTPLKLVSILEMSIAYLCILGVVFLFRFQNKKVYFFITFFALSFLCVYGLICPNIGTLYRVRFAYEFLLIILGVVGWIDWIYNKIEAHKGAEKHA